MYKTYQLTLDTERASKPLKAGEFSANTLDAESVKFIFNLTQDKKPLNLSGATVKLAIRKPDGNIVFQNGSVDNILSGLVSFVLETQSYNVAGAHVAEVMVYYTGGRVITTRAFSYNVIEGILTDAAVESTSWYQDINELQLLVADLEIGLNEQINQAMVEATADATLAAETANQRVAELNGFETSITSQLAETMKTGKPTIGYAGVIRRDATGWFYIEDAVHEKVNMLTVSETANNEIEVTYTDAGKVGSMIVAPDETLASLGVIAGASVGDYRAYIKCYAPFVGYISSNGTVINTNALFTGTATSVVSVDKTKMTVAYDGAGNGLDKTLVSPVNDNAAPFTGVDYHTSRTGAGTVEVRAFHPLYANVAFDGTNWVVTTKCVANITAAWDGATNELVITHDGMPSGAGYTQFMDVALTMRKSTSGALIHGRVTSVNTTQIRIEFYAAGGAKLTAASNEMRLYISRPGFKVPHEIPPGARLYFDFGYSIVRPSKLQIPFSNLWILGVHNT